MTDGDEDIGFCIKFAGYECVGKTNLVFSLAGIDFEEEYVSTTSPCYTKSSFSI